MAIKSANLMSIVAASVAVFGVAGMSHADNDSHERERERGRDRDLNPSAALQVFATKVTSCSGGDHPEVALQGQVPAALRSSFKGFNCNLEVIGQFRGEGGNWSTATFRGNGRTCAYHATGTPVPLRPNPGVPVIDITNPTAPTRLTSLTTKAMLDPWESLRVNQHRKLLMGDNGTNSGGGPDMDVYDLSDDCRSPQLMSSVPLTYKTGDPAAPEKPMNGHEGNISPDGRTYYVGDLTNGKYHAVDLTNPTRPHIIATYDIKAKSPIANRPHGLSISKDGNRAYVAALVIPTLAQGADPNFKQNGFLVLDTSDVQARKPNPDIRLVSAVAYKDGSVAQHPIITKVRGKPVVIMVDEGGSGGLANTAAVKVACAAGLAPFPMARIYDMSDERNPKLMSKLGLETHDVNHCSAVLPDITGLEIFTYGSHYCSVDNVENATALACSYFNSGIRVFDIREPAKPKEIAYLNPPGQTTPVLGSNHVAFGQWRSGGPDWCASRLDFDRKKGLLTTMCQDNGLMVMKFKNGVWPFDESEERSEQDD